MQGFFHAIYNRPSSVVLFHFLRLSFSSAYTSPCVVGEGISTECVLQTVYSRSRSARVFLHWSSRKTCPAVTRQMGACKRVICILSWAYAPFNLREERAHTCCRRPTRRALMLYLPLTPIERARELNIEFDLYKRSQAPRRSNQIIKYRLTSSQIWIMIVTSS